jgi:DNA-binding HxlR family transcriptional regulator
LEFPEYASCDSPYACSAAPIIARKWVPVSVCHLLNGPKRFSDLKRNIPYVSGKVLTDNLRFMQAEGMVIREVREGQPVEVWYRLTARGMDLGAVIRAMNTWGQKWLQVPVSSNEPVNAAKDARPKRAVIPLSTEW